MPNEESFINDQVKLICGECIEAMASMAENFLDAAITDPPYHLASIVKRFGKPGSAPAKSNGETGVYKRASAGFMGKEWDGGDIAFDPETWRAVYRVLKPGAHLLAFGAPRNFGFMQVAIAEAGFEIRDVLCWLFGQGFPKNHDVKKGIEKLVGVQPVFDAETGKLNDPSEDQSKEWEGWGTALKPGYEPILLCRKPLDGTVAANVLEHGTGAINIDACRVSVDPDADASQLRTMQRGQRTDDTSGQVWGLSKNSADEPQVVRSEGRFPANVVHDGSAEVVELFPQSKGQQGEVKGDEPSECHSGVYSGPRGRLAYAKRGDLGSAARFFYCAKATAADRAASKHPTVKPIALMRWLVRMVAPKGSLILDPFAGTGTLGEAAALESVRSILIEREEEYQKNIRFRMHLLMCGPEERERELLKARGQLKSEGDLPLFEDKEAA